jgi:hypothetical protein
VTDSSYFKKGDGALSLKVKDLEQTNYQLQENLTRNQWDFKDLLTELTSIKQEMKTKDDQIRHYESEIRLRPNVAQMNAKKVQIEHL